jgi:hypothetical protein
MIEVMILCLCNIVSSFIGGGWLLIISLSNATGFGVTGVQVRVHFGPISVYILDIQNTVS